MSDDCPATEEIWAAVSGELPAERTRSLGAHTVECSACAELWRLAREVGAEPSARRVRGSRRWVGLAAAAVLAVVALTTLVMVREDPSDPVEPGLRTPSDDIGIQSLISPGQALSREDCRLIWEGPEGASYTVTVTTGDLRPVLEVTDIWETSLSISPELLSTMPAGSELLWRVTGELPNGDVVRRAFRSALADPAP